MEYNKMSPEELVKAIEGKDAEIVTLKKENEATKKELADTIEVNETLSAEVAKKGTTEAKTAQPDNSISTETFTVNKKKYGFAMSFVSYKGNRISAKEVLASKELQEEFVKRKIGLIKEI